MKHQNSSQLGYQLLGLNQIKIEEEINLSPQKKDIDDTSFDIDPDDMKDEISSFSPELSEITNSESQPAERILTPPEELQKEYKQPRLHPYRFKDYRREIITKDISLHISTQFYQDIFEQKRKQQDIIRKEKILKKIDQLFQFQETLGHIPFNIKINRLESTLDSTINTLQQTQLIPAQIDRISSTQRKFYPMEHFTCNLSFRKNILRVIPLFTKLYEKFYHRTEVIVAAFIDGMTSRRLLPLNQIITIDSVENCRDSCLIPIALPSAQFWIIKIYNKSGFGFYYFKWQVSIALFREKPELIELVNFHQDDPRKFKSTINLSPEGIKEALETMLPSDIGWIFQYEDLKVKNFMELTHFLFLDQEKQTIIQYFEIFYYQVIILSQIPIFKLGKIFAMNGQTVKLQLKKEIRESQLETKQDILSYFGECILINAPKQRMEGVFNQDQKIIFDFFTRKFTMTGTQLPQLSNDIIEIKQLNIIM